MAVTSGFFNSINSDRRYDALQMAELFDGLINDGVYETIYNQFRVSPSEAFTIQVDTGRGWFNHTWIKNDGIKLLALDEPEVLYDRIDAVVIEVDHRDEVRADDIKVVKGTPSAEPERPTLSNENDVYQHPLAYILVKSNTIEISASDITNMVGSSACPFVTGVVSVMDIDWLMAQWQSQWEDKMKDHDRDWDIWYKEHTSQYDYDFNYWFSQLQLVLEGDVVTNLTKKILDLEEQMKMLMTQHLLEDTILDSNNDPLLDHNDQEIQGTVAFITSGEYKPCVCETSE